MNDVPIVIYSYTILTVCYALRLHVVEMKAFFCRFFPLCARLAIVCIWIDGQTTAWRKLTPYLDVLWIHQLDKVFHDDIDAIFMEIPMVTETK